MARARALHPGGSSVHMPCTASALVCIAVAIICSPHQAAHWSQPPLAPLCLTGDASHHRFVYTPLGKFDRTAGWNLSAIHNPRPHAIAVYLGAVPAPRQPVCLCTRGVTWVKQPCCKLDGEGRRALLVQGSSVHMPCPGRTPESTSVMIQSTSVMIQPQLSCEVQMLSYLALPRQRTGVNHPLRPSGVLSDWGPHPTAHFSIHSCHTAVNECAR